MREKRRGKEREYKINRKRQEGREGEKNHKLNFNKLYESKSWRKTKRKKIHKYEFT